MSARFYIDVDPDGDPAVYDGADSQLPLEALNSAYVHSEELWLAIVQLVESGQVTTAADRYSLVWDRGSA